MLQIACSLSREAAMQKVPVRFVVLITAVALTWRSLRQWLPWAFSGRPVLWMASAAFGFYIRLAMRVVWVAHRQVSRLEMLTGSLSMG